MHVRIRLLWRFELFRIYSKVSKPPVDFLNVRDVEFCQGKSMFMLFLAASKVDPFRRTSQMSLYAPFNVYGNFQTRTA